MKCDDIPKLRNGSIEEFNFGNTSQAIFKCNSGFTLVGDQTLTCATDGSWNASFPFCGNLNEIFKGNKSITIYHNCPFRCQTYNLILTSYLSRNFLRVLGIYCYKVWRLYFSMKVYKNSK